MGFGDEVAAAGKPIGHRMALDLWLNGRDDRDEIVPVLMDPTYGDAQLHRALVGRGYERSESSVRTWRVARGVR